MNRSSMGQQIAKPGKVKRMSEGGLGKGIARILPDNALKAMSSTGDYGKIARTYGLSKGIQGEIDRRRATEAASTEGAPKVLASELQATTAASAMSKGGKVKSRVNEAGNYTKPTMRKALFERIKAGGKGGKPGQWSARKAQMVATQYKAKGGGYRD